MHYTTNAALPRLQDSKVHVYSLENGTLKAMKELSHTGAITCLEFSPDGAYLAVGDSNRKVCLYQCPDYEVWILVTQKKKFKSEKLPAHYFAVSTYQFAERLTEYSDFDPVKLFQGNFQKRR